MPDLIFLYIENSSFSSTLLWQLTYITDCASQQGIPYVNVKTSEQVEDQIEGAAKIDGYHKLQT